MAILTRAHNIPAVPVASKVLDANGMLSAEYVQFLRWLADIERHVLDVEVLARFTDLAEGGTVAAAATPLYEWIIYDATVGADVCNHVRVQGAGTCVRFEVDVKVAPTAATTVRVNKNGSSILTSDFPLASGATGLTGTTSFALSGLNDNDLLTFDVATGNNSGQFTAFLMVA